MAYDDSDYPLPREIDAFVAAKLFKWCRVGWSIDMGDYTGMSPSLIGPMLVPGYTSALELTELLADQLEACGYEIEVREDDRVRVTLTGERVHAAEAATLGVALGRAYWRAVEASDVL